MNSAIIILIVVGTKIALLELAKLAMKYVYKLKARYGN